MEEENETEEVPVCDFCLLPAQQSEADIVELRCNTRGCKDYEGATYHFECMCALHAASVPPDDARA